MTQRIRFYHIQVSSLGLNKVPHGSSYFWMRSGASFEFDSMNEISHRNVCFRERESIEKICLYKTRLYKSRLWFSLSHRRNCTCVGKIRFWRTFDKAENPLLAYSSAFDDTARVYARRRWGPLKYLSPDMLRVSCKADISVVPHINTSKRTISRPRPPDCTTDPPNFDSYRLKSLAAVFKSRRCRIFHRFTVRIVWKFLLLFWYSSALFKRTHFLGV